MESVKNIYIETYGCVANQNNSEIISGLLARAGFNMVNNEKIADLAILNTCIVKGPTLQRMESRIKDLRKRFKKIIVTGCMPDVFPGQILQIAPNAILLSNHKIKDITKIIKDIIENKIISAKPIKEHEIKLLCPKNRRNPVIGTTQISEGCTGNCAYCVTRLAKGSLFSYPEQEILKNIERDLQAGCKEIWITAQDTAAYGIDKNKKSQLPKLLKKILGLKHNFILRMGMSNPNHILPILPELIECYQSKKMFKFLHIPLQSGSNEMLKKMNRYYKAEDFLKICGEFRKKIPEMTISTDVILGFPGETEGDFQKTLRAIEKIRPEIINLSRFWPMPKTPASKIRERIPDRAVMRRSKILKELFVKFAIEKNKKYIGRKIEVLADEKGSGFTWIARSQEYKGVVIASKEKLLGEKIAVIIKSATPQYLIGEIIRNNPENKKTD